MHACNRVINHFANTVLHPIEGDNQVLAIGDTPHRYHHLIRIRPERRDSDNRAALGETCSARRGDVFVKRVNQVVSTLRTGIAALDAYFAG